MNKSELTNPSYIDEIASALTRVLTVACDGTPDKFAEYSANAEFWVAEARHALDVIDGYERRFENMKHAAQSDLRNDSTRTESPMQRSTKYSDRAAARSASIAIS
jgi:hypothetical protein